MPPNICCHLVVATFSVLGLHNAVLCRGASQVVVSTITVVMCSFRTATDLSTDRYHCSNAPSTGSSMYFFFKL